LDGLFQRVREDDASPFDRGIFVSLFGHVAEPLSDILLPNVREQDLLPTRQDVLAHVLLDLTAARAEHTRVSVTSLCIASGVPPTTALRWIGQMTEVGLFERIEDDSDRRRAFIALTEKAADAMARYFAELGRNASRLV